MIKKFKLLNVDVLDGLRSLKSESVDLIIADPPYNLDKDFGIWKEKEKKADWLSWCHSWLDECKRVLSPKGNIFIYGIHHHLCWIQVYLYQIGLTYRRQIIWHYENGFSAYTNNLAAHYEPLLWFSKSKFSYFYPPREPYKSQERLKYAVNKNGKVWKPNPEGRRVGDVWKFPTLAGKLFENEKVDHPTQKPLAISRRIVAHFSPLGGEVLIPFIGSGSECVAAFLEGREFTGFEINPTYINIAMKRLAIAQESKSNSLGKPRIQKPTSRQYRVG